MTTAPNQIDELPLALDPFDRLSDVLGKIAAQIDHALAEYEAIAAESRASLERLVAMADVNPLAHLIGGSNA